MEIVTAPGATPNPIWLNFVTTGKARANIRHYLKNLQNDKAIELGRRLLDNELIKSSRSLLSLTEKQQMNIVQNLKLPTFDDLLADIGLGNRPPILQWSNQNSQKHNSLMIL